MIHEKNYRSWSSFKSAMTSHEASNTIQYETLDDNRYLIDFYDGSFVGHYILKFSDISDKADFDDNYKNNANQPLRKTNYITNKPTYGYSEGLTPYWNQVPYEAIAGQLSIFDYEVTSEIKVVYPSYRIVNFNDVHSDDYIEMSIVDKNDVLGLFAQYGLSVDDGDVLELYKTVYDWHPYESEFQFRGIFGAQPVVAGLFLRLYYRSYGTTNILLSNTLNWYQ